MDIIYIYIYISKFICSFKSSSMFNYRVFIIEIYAAWSTLYMLLNCGGFVCARARIE